MSSLEKTEDEKVGPPLAGGANQVRVRHHNERLLLTVLRRQGALSKAEIARRTGLSAQTVTVITRALEKDSLISRGDPVRGRVGQPSIPMSLAPEGAYSIGLKVGRRSAELALMDFTGRIRMQERQTYPYPLPETILAFARDRIGALLPEGAERDRLAGLGVATPFELWNWADRVGAPRGDMDAWRGLDMRAALADATGLPTFLENDCTAACSAEVMLGHGRNTGNFAYFFIGFFIGGGLALDHNVFTGIRQSAGGMGPIAVGREGSRIVQLLDHASLAQLEDALQTEGTDPSVLWTSPEDWSAVGPAVERWIAETADHLAVAMISVCCVIDFETVVLDGAFPDAIGGRIVEATQERLSHHDIAGVRPFRVVQGQVGSAARVVGAASLPLQARYLVDPSVLFGTGAG
ncbi:MAG: ROK family transcriptional regulator [Pseudomonadota bacterium]